MQVNITMAFDLMTTAGQTQFAQLLQTLMPQSPPVEHTGGVVTLFEVPPPPSINSNADTIKANRQQAAANARAVKAAKAAAEGTTPGPVEQVLGPADPVEQVLGPADDLLGGGITGDAEDPKEDLGLSDPSMSPGEARDAGLAMVREAYAAGRVAEVKVLQKEWQVAKFYDVPVERGHEFYARVMKLCQETGLRK